MREGTRGRRAPFRARSPIEVVAVLARAAVEGRFPHWATGLTVLAAFDGRDWLLADQLARRPHAALTTRDGQLWSAVNLDDPSGFVAVVTSWHADGHLREQAVEVLANRRGPVIASALAVRLLDHVPQVREAALRALRPQLSADVAEPVLGVLVAAEHRHHAPPALTTVLTALDGGGELDEALRTLTAATDPGLRRWAHAEAHRRHLLTAEL